MRRWYRFFVLKVDMMVERDGVISGHAHDVIQRGFPPTTRHKVVGLQNSYLFLHANTHKPIPQSQTPMDLRWRGCYICPALDIVNRNVRTGDDRLDNAPSIFTLPHTRGFKRDDGVREPEPK